MSSVYDAFRNRRSRSKVTDTSPTHEEVVRIIEAAARVPDHSSLHPWRVIELRGDSRTTLGNAIAAAEGKTKQDASGYVKKAHRAGLLLAVVFSPRPSKKVPQWEQEATASAIALALTILLEDEGWGVFWRTGPHTRSEPVRQAHKLTNGEELMGWLYVGGTKDHENTPKKSVTPEDYLSQL